jgi:hypothetical protein
VTLQELEARGDIRRERRAGRGNPKGIVLLRTVPSSTSSSPTDTISTSISGPATASG